MSQSAHESARPYTSSIASPLLGTANVPGDKSISHRALLLSSQVLGTTTIYGLLEGEDVLRTAKALQALGVTIDNHYEDGDKRQRAAHRWVVEGVGVGGLAESEGVLDMGNSGTGARLMMGLVAPYPYVSIFTGDHSLVKRPMGRVAKPLEGMGVEVMAREGYRLPLALKGQSALVPITYRLPVASAQVKSAILLAGLNTPGKTTVIEPTPTRDHTERMLKHLGFEVEVEDTEDGRAISVQGHQSPKPQDRELNVPADPSSAAFLAVAALITPGSDLTLPAVCLNDTRVGVFTTLKEMGANIVYENKREVCGEPVADLHIKSSQLKGVTVPAERAPSMIDEYPILAVAAAYAKGTTTCLGLEELRVKESDRLTAVADGLTACGVKATIKGDDLVIEGTGGVVPGGGTVTTHYDHRIAMSFMVMGMKSRDPIKVDDTRAIATSFPKFATIMNRLGAHMIPADESNLTRFKPMVVAIDGPAASGKGTLARRVSAYCGYPYLDTGSLYRAVGMQMLKHGLDVNDTEAAITTARNLDDVDFSDPRLRQEAVGQAASIVSAIPEVRQALLEFQRRFSERSDGAVLDGRDIGTVVCPEADLKFFVTASVEARAHRRHRELRGQDVDVTFDTVLEEMKERDERDSKRSVAALVAADDAILIDTSSLSAKEVFETVIRHIQEKNTEN